MGPGDEEYSTHSPRRTPADNRDYDHSDVIIVVTLVCAVLGVVLAVMGGFMCCRLLQRRLERTNSEVQNARMRPVHSNYQLGRNMYSSMDNLSYVETK